MIKGFETVTHDAEQTTALGKQIGEQLQKGSVVCLFGDLGAGKTTFVKGLAAAVNGVEDSFVSSPTFTYLNIYEGVNTLYHFDLYRLTDSDSFLAMGFDEYFCGEAICVVEWSERIASLLFDDVIKIFLTHQGPNSRKILVEGLRRVDEKVSL